MDSNLVLVEKLAGTVQITTQLLQDALRRYKDDFKRKEDDLKGEPVAKEAELREDFRKREEELKQGFSKREEELKQGLAAKEAEMREDFRKREEELKEGVRKREEELKEAFSKREEELKAKMAGKAADAAVEAVKAMVQGQRGTSNEGQVGGTAVLPGEERPRPSSLPSGSLQQKKTERDADDREKVEESNAVTKRLALPFVLDGSGVAKSKNSSAVTVTAEEELSDYEKLRLKNVSECQQQFRLLFPKAETRPNPAKRSRSEDTPIWRKTHSHDLRERTEKKKSEDDQWVLDYESGEDAGFAAANIEDDFEQAAEDGHQQAADSEGESHGVPSGPFPCEECDSVFETPKSIAYHVMTAHRKQVPCNYDGCDMVFPSQTVLKHHLATEHCEGTSAKAYLCRYDRCDKAYASRKGLYLHVRCTHRKDLYSCSDCPMKFASPQTLRRHEVGVHGHDHKNEKIHCPICDKVFVDNHAMKSHSNKVHKKDIPCPNCDMFFSTRSDLHRHVSRRHSGQSPCLP